MFNSFSEDTNTAVSCSEMVFMCRTRKIEAGVFCSLLRIFRKNVDQMERRPERGELKMERGKNKKRPLIQRLPWKVEKIAGVQFLGGICS